jgi:group I intron endonuclease
MSLNSRVVMPSTGKVYCAHCIFTGKKYIGQTVKNNLNLRINEHFMDCKRYNHKFANALKKYGKEGFIWGIVEECNLSTLDDREIHWISKYKTVENGYNLSPGGGQPSEYFCKEYLVETPSGERIKILNLSKYCRNNHLNVGHLHETLYGKRIQHKGYKLIPRNNEEIKRYENERKVREDTSRKGLKGERNGRAILNWNKVEQIRQMHSSKKYKNQEISNIFGIKLGTLEKIVSNKLWTV